MWDTGAVSDDSWTPTGGHERRVILSDYRERPVTVRQTPKALAASGYHATITYLALSHYHWDHTANANAFANATWLVRKVERDACFRRRRPRFRNRQRLQRFTPAKRS